MSLGYNQSYIQNQLSIGLEFIINPFGYVFFDFRNPSNSGTTTLQDSSAISDFIALLGTGHWICVSHELTNKHATKDVQISYKPSNGTEPADAFNLEPLETLNSPFGAFPISELGIYNDIATTEGTGPVNQAGDHRIRVRFSMLQL